jgi:hypothetical protein
MATSAAAFAELKARAVDNLGTLPMYWPHEVIELPDTPVTFAYFEFITSQAELAGFGSGRGANLYRNPAEWIAYVFVPIGQGLTVALTQAETIAALYRSYRTSVISCFAASVEPVGQGADLVPPGLRSAAGNYACAIVRVDLFFDQIG